MLDQQDTLILNKESPGRDSMFHNGAFFRGTADCIILLQNLVKSKARQYRN